MENFIRDSDQEQILIERAKKNPKDFAPLYEKYYKSIFLFVHRRVNDSSLASDISSQVFLKALSSLSKYKYQGFAFSSWLYRVAINEVNEFFRKNKVRRCFPLEFHGVESLFESFDSGDEDYQEKEAKLIKALKSLETEDLQLIDLRFFEGRSFKEIAYLLNITENNAKVKTYRIIDKLKKFFFSR
ncbi:MAG: RNA polymerase sigma factor [Cytophagaceae bacterium]